MGTTKFTLIAAGVLVSLSVTACGSALGGHNESYQKGHDFGSKVTYADIVDPDQICSLTAAGVVAADAPDKDSFTKGCVDGMHSVQSRHK